jgi:hypothetical protein
LKVGTSSYGGKELRKTAVVYTNDPQQPRISLQISGKVENFVIIQPAYVRLTGEVGQPIQVPVSIVPTAKYPFQIVNTRASNGTNIRYELKQRSAAEGNGYTLMVENLKQNEGRYHDTILLQTDSSIQPEISIRIFGYIYGKKERKAGS